MSIKYSIVAKIKDPSIKAALSKALADDGRLSTNEVKEIIYSAYDFKGVTIKEFEDIQTILNESKSINDESKKIISEFSKKYYHSYLEYQQKKKTVLYTIDHIPSSLKRRPGTKLIAEYLTIHSTGNPSLEATGERKWLTDPRNTKDASFHVVVDETQAIECIPLDEVSWHAGDEKSKIGNLKSIGLEICESGDRALTLRNAAAVAAKILREKGLGADKLMRHKDWTGKNCPRILIDISKRGKSNQTWDWFKSEVADRM